MDRQEIKQEIAVAMGSEPADLVLKNANIINVFSSETEQCDVAITNGIIVGLGEYQGKEEIDLQGQYVCPGLIDGHIHIESSMLCGPEFENAVLPHGTTAVITDPHEISNVAGTQGLDFMLETTKDLDLSVYFVLPSCVPATPLDESGATLQATDLKPYYANPRVLGLAEMMNDYGTIHGDDGILDKIRDSVRHGGIVDGHAPFVLGKDLNAYVTAGVQSDHECSDIDEAKEKLRRGQYIMVREGTAAKNLEALAPLLAEPYCNRCMLVTDDKHPGDLLTLGHIDYIIRKAISLGVKPATAVKAATLIPAQYFGLKNHGAVAPGYVADLLVVSDLENFSVAQVYKKGKLVAEKGAVLHKHILSANRESYPKVFESFSIDALQPEDLALKETGTQERVIWLTPHELLTKEVCVPYQEKSGYAPGVDVEQQIVKLAVCERHHKTGHIGLGFLGGYGLKKGAVASSIAHDSHNLIIAGTNDADMLLAGNCVIKNKGGLAFVVDGKVLGELALPVGGLMSAESATATDEKLRAMKAKIAEYGLAQNIDAFMTLGFVSLPVIPEIRLNTYGVIDVNKQKAVPPVF